MTDKLRDLIEDVRTVYKGKGMLVSPNSFDRLRTEIIKLDNINKQQSEQIEKLEEENEELKLINKKLQCCGNCKKYRMSESQVPLRCLKNRKAYSCCEDWEMDE